MSVDPVRQRRFRVQLAAELLGDFRHAALPSDRLLAKYFSERKYLGADDRRVLGDLLYQTLRHLRRYDRALRRALQDAYLPFSHNVHRATGFPCDEPPNDRVWACPGPPADRPSMEARWIDRMRVALAAEELEPSLIKNKGLMEELVQLWPQSLKGYDPQWVQGTIQQAIDLAQRYRSETKPSEFALKHSFHDWQWALMGYGLPPDELDALMGALNGTAPVALRVNRLLTTPDKYAEKLKAAGIAFERPELAPDAFLLESRVPRFSLPGQLEGEVEFQDVASQMVAELIKPVKGSVVVDACAGAGGKTLHLGAMMENTGRLFVHEPAEGRLENLHERAKRAKLTIVEELDKATGQCSPPPSEFPPVDLVLIDAPCSGMGTLRRSPELKLRLTRDDLQKKVALQLQLLEHWSQWVRPGGLLAYATCSILHVENGERVTAFLAKHPEFKRVDWKARDARIKRSMLTPEGDLQFYPHRHGCDGFFLALLEKKKK